MDKESEAYKSGEFEEMFEAAELGSLAAEDIVAYSESKRRYDDMQMAYEYSYSKGEAEGRAEGIAEGRNMTIRLLYSNGMSIELISKYLDVPKDDIEKILM